MTIAKSTTSTNKDKQEKKVEAEFFHIDMIPDAMEEMGWKIAPKLMRHWFSIAPAFCFSKENKKHLLDMDASMIAKEKISTDIIKMSWAIQYKQVENGIKELSKMWNSVKGKERLIDQLNKVGDYRDEQVKIGYSDDVRVLDASAQINILTVGKLTDTLDDWFGAMGTSSLKVCVRGYSSIENSKSVFNVYMIGFYLKDTYDFLDEGNFPELLGVWGKNRVLSKADTVLYMNSYLPGYMGWLVENFSGFVPVFNGDFRRWQKKHNTGGNFILFSDVLWIYPEVDDKVIFL